MSTVLRTLLVGGSGFMGPVVADALLARGHSVTLLTRGHHPTPAGCDTLTADRSDPEALRAELEGRQFDLTVDFLAFDSVDVERLLTLPYAALGRYVMISSGQVYLIADGATPPYREDDAEHAVIPEPPEGTSDHASWRYGLGKRRAERSLLALRGTHGVRAVALRLPIVQGERDGSLRLWAYLERMLDGGPLLLPDGGERLVRHLDVEDVARAIVWLAEHDPPRGAMYNLAQPEVVPFRELLERTAAIVGVTPRWVPVPWEEMRAAGLDERCSPYAGRWASVLDPSRAAAEWGLLGTRLETWLPRVVRWHLEHRPPTSHPGYAQRATELELAARMAGAARG